MDATIAQCKGLFTGPNSETAGPGSLKQAVNVVLRRPDLLEQRRGVAPYTQLLASNFPGYVSGNINAIFGYKNRLHTVFSGGQLYSDDGTGNGKFVSNATTFTGPPSTVQQVPAPELNGNVYLPFLTNGVYKLDALGGVAYKAGAPRALDLSLTGVGVAVGGILLSGAVAYRVAFFTTDANNNLIIGPPSGRAVYFAPSPPSTQNITVKTFIPADILNAPASIQTKFGYQIYRTTIQPPGLASAYADPGDECGLVYQAFLTATDIANKFISVTDVYNDTLAKGPSLYSNASQQGIAAANFQPPLCKDAVFFKNAIFYGNTTSKHRTSTSMLGTPDLWAIQSIAANTPIAGQSTYTFLANVVDQSIDNTMKLSVLGTTGGSNDGVWNIVSKTATTVVVTNAGVAQAGVAGNALVGAIFVGGRTYYATQQAEVPASNYFQAYTNSTVSQNISNTALSFCRVMSQDVSQTACYSFYAAGPDDIPGLLAFEEQGIGGASFTVLGTPTIYAQKFAPTIDNTKTSQNDASISRVYYSKYGQPEHVPLGNYFEIGSKTKAVLRLIGLRDSLFVFKEDGVFRITGDGSNWNVTRFDDTLFLLYPSGGYASGVCVANNTIFAFTNKGIVSLTDNYARIVSDPVSNLLRFYIDQPVAKVTTAVSENDALVYFYISAGNNIQYPALGIIFNIRTGTWTQFDVGSGSLAGNTPLCSYGITVNNLMYRLTATSFPIYSEFHINSLNEQLSLNSYTFQSFLPVDGYIMTVTGVSGMNVTVTAPTGLGSTIPSVGDLLRGGNNQGINYTGGKYYTITAVSGVGPYTLTVAGYAPSGGTITDIFNGDIMGMTSIPLTVEWNPFTGGDDRREKRWTAVSILLDSICTDVTTATVGVYTDINRSRVDQTTGTINIFSLRTLVPSPSQRARRMSVVFKHSNAAQHVFIKGVSYTFESYDNGRGVE